MSNESENFSLPHNWQVPEPLRHRLGNNVGRQRMMECDGHLLIVAHRVPTAGEATRRGVLFWRNPEGIWETTDSNYRRGKVINSRPQFASESVSSTVSSTQAAASELSPSLALGPGGLLIDYAKAIEHFDQLESKANRADEYLPLLEGLSPFVRSSRNLLEVLQESRRAFKEAKELIDFRDRAYEISRTAELLYQDAKNSMDVAVVRRAEEQAMASQQMSVAAHRLNTLAALFFPLATLGAIFGTTLTDNWSWSNSPIGFYMFLATGLITGGLLALFVNRKSHLTTNN